MTSERSDSNRQRLIVTIGDLVEDVVVVPSGPIAIGSDVASSITRRRGGSAPNVAAAIVAAGGHARFVGRVGDDALGDRLVAAVSAEGVEPAVQRGGHSGSVVVLVADGERSFLTDRGCSVALGPVDPAWVTDAAVVHLPAYCLVGGSIAQHAVAAARAARSAGAQVSVDASSVSVIEELGADRLVAECVALGCDVLLANEDEAAALGPVDDLLRSGIGIVVVKRGSDETLAYSATEAVTARPLPIRGRFDPTGAGDAFAAGFLLAHIDGATLHAAVVAGNATANRLLTAQPMVAAAAAGRAPGSSR